jgi:hypothetical protein
MNKLEASVAMLAGGAIILSVASLQSPPDCQIVVRGERQFVWCPPPDKTAGIVAALAGGGLIVLAVKSWQRPEVATINLGSNAMPSGFAGSVNQAIEPKVEAEQLDKKKALWQKLHQDEYSWLLQLILTKPLLIWGEQCSGKSKFAGFLAMLRMLFFNHQVSVADPHAHQNDWPFEVYGHHYNYGAIDKRLIAYYERLKAGDIPYTSIWDEVTNYSENCDEKLAGRFLKSILSDVRKPPEFPILLSHSNTLNSLGGGKGGVKQMQIRGLVEVNLRAKRDKLGNLMPALKGTVTGLKLDEKGNAISQPLELEPWMQPSWMLSEFPELQRQINSPRSQPDSDVNFLENCWETTKQQRVKQLLAEGFNQTEIIKDVWNVSPGDSNRYREALTEYKQLTEENEQ